MRALLVVVVIACKVPVLQQPVGTRVPIAELRQADLPTFIRAEVAAKHDARAFFALELYKTRPYIGQQLGAIAARERPTKRDLRPLFAGLQAAADSRGLHLVTSAAAGAPAVPDSAAVWDHLALFERRTKPLDEWQGGIEYDDATRHAYGVSSAEEIGRLFASEELFVSFLVAGDDVLVFAIAKHHLAVHVVPGAAALRTEVAALVAAARDPSTGDAWRAHAAKISGALLAPLAGELDRDLSAIYISPHDFLANLPFGLLPDRTSRLLADRMRIAYVPSASVYRQVLSRPLLSAAPRLLAVGNAIYPSQIPPLPSAEREAVVVSELFPHGQLLEGARATESKIVELAPKYNILHFATHGVLVRAQPDASSLLVTADDANDGFLSASEIASLDLSSVYVAVLSACESSASSGTDLASITSAFISAGAPTVIGSLWEVDDAATTRLMLAFYEQFLADGAGDALRKAATSLRADPTFAHPYYWAAFVVYGWDK